MANGFTGTQLEVRAINNRVNTALGYPRAGTRVGRGPHPAEIFVTRRYTRVLRRRLFPSEWAIVVDSTVNTHLTTGERARVATLNSDWNDVVEDTDP